MYVLKSGYKNLQNIKIKYLNLSVIDDRTICHFSNRNLR